MSERRQSIKQALRSTEIVRALSGLVGCPVGGWAETKQAMARIDDAIPIRSLRSYTASSLVEAAMRVDSAQRYQWIDDGKAQT